MSAKEPKTRRKSAGRKAVRTASKVRSLESVVGPEVYRVWVDMLSVLGRDGRTHRLAVVIAAMLQHASHAASEASKRRGSRDVAVDHALLNALQEPEPGGEDEDLTEVVVRLFEDAGVPHSRTNRRGDESSLVDPSIDEFVRWFDMPWE